MAHSFHAHFVHVVFSTKHRRPWLTFEIRQRLWKVMHGILKRHGIDSIAIGGYEDHCHALISLPSTESVAKAVKTLKGASSKWLSDEYPELRSFAWQVGYAEFSVSTSQLTKVIEYIANQEEHHTKVSFHDEYVAFLRANNIVFDERSVFSDEPRPDPVHD